MNGPTCSHRVSESIFYTPAVNEDGWRCDDCQLSGQYWPELEQTPAGLLEKVMGILQAMDMAKLVTISNGTEGEIVQHNVCKALWEAEPRLTDQYTIMAAILRDPNLTGHAVYWGKRASGEIPEPVPAVFDF